MAAITIHLGSEVFAAIAHWAPQEQMSAEEFILAAISEKCDKAHALDEAERFWDQLPGIQPASAASSRLMFAMADAV